MGGEGVLGRHNSESARNQAAGLLCVPHAKSLHMRCMNMNAANCGTLCCVWRHWHNLPRPCIALGLDAQQASLRALAAGPPICPTCSPIHKQAASWPSGLPKCLGLLCGAELLHSSPAAIILLACAWPPPSRSSRPASPVAVNNLKPPDVCPSSSLCCCRVAPSIRHALRLLTCICRSCSPTRNLGGAWTARLRLEGCGRWGVIRCRHASRASSGSASSSSRRTEHFSRDSGLQRQGPPPPPVTALASTHFPPRISCDGVPTQALIAY